MHANGTVTDHTYDNASRLKDVWHQLGANTISRQTYTMDSLGNRTQAAELLAHVGAAATSSTITYGYDRVSRLTGVTAPSGTTSYTYDPAGNRLARTRGTTDSYSYDRTDRVTSAAGVTYQLNANGSLTSRGTDTFTYDQENRLKSAVVSGTTTTYIYDGDGMRISSTTGGTTTFYVYDAATGLPVLLDDGSRKYVWGLDLTYSVDTTNALHVFHTDGLGSIRAITDATGTVVQAHDTDEFGIVTRAQGTLTQPFGFRRTA